MTENTIEVMLERLKKNEMFLDWIGDDPTKFLNARREMHFIKCDHGIVTYKLMIGFHKGEDTDREIAKIMRFAIENTKSDTAKQEILKNLPPGIAHLAMHSPEFLEQVEADK